MSTASTKITGHSIYLAGPYERRQWLREEIAPKLLEWGHHITSSWINDPPENENIAEYLRARRRGEALLNTAYEKILAHEALRDILDVQNSTMLIRFPNPNGSISGGRFVEMGLAIAYGLIVAVVGNYECVFDYCKPVQVYENLDVAFDGLGLVA